MTEDELVELLTRTQQRQEPENVTGTTKDVQKKLLRGYKELAAFLHCHVSTAYRKVACGDLHAPCTIGPSSSGSAYLCSKTVVT